MADFNIYRRDLQQLACDDTLDVFRLSDILRQIQTVQTDETQELYDAIIGSLDARTLDNAKEKNLDVIGRIVGLYPRPLIDAGNIIYFAPDLPLNAVDLGNVYVQNAPLAGLVPIGDVDYRIAIRAKIIKNHTKYGSAPELLYYARFAYGINISVKNIGNSELRVVFPSTASANIVQKALSQVNDETADHQYEMPIPTTGRIREVFFRPLAAFGPDLVDGAVDIAPVGVGYVVNP